MTGSVAVALGSGGLKQMAALPLFEFLDRADVQLAGVAGTSGGALVAALRAFGMSPREIAERAPRLWPERLFRQFRLRALFGLLGLPGGAWRPGDGLLRREQICDPLDHVFGDARIEDLQVPLVVVATDLETGEPVAIDRGRIADAVYASLAQPPLLPAAEIGGRLLIDGGYTESVAIERTFAFAPDTVIAVTNLERTQTPPKGLGAAYAHLLSRTNSELERWIIERCRRKFAGELIVLNVEFDRPIPWWDATTLGFVLECGERMVPVLRARLAPAAPR